MQSRRRWRRRACTIGWLQAVSKDLALQVTSGKPKCPPDAVPRSGFHADAVVERTFFETSNVNLHAVGRRLVDHSSGGRTGDRRAAPWRLLNHDRTATILLSSDFAGPRSCFEKRLKNKFLLNINNDLAQVLKGSEFCT